jgi:hypothetical protein
MALARGLRRKPIGLIYFAQDTDKRYILRFRLRTDGEIGESFHDLRLHLSRRSPGGLDGTGIRHGFPTCRPVDREV